MGQGLIDLLPLNRYMLTDPGCDRFHLRGHHRPEPGIQPLYHVIQRVHGFPERPSHQPGGKKPDDFIGNDEACDHNGDQIEQHGHHFPIRFHTHSQTDFLNPGICACRMITA